MGLGAFRPAEGEDLWGGDFRVELKLTQLSRSALWVPYSPCLQAALVQMNFRQPHLGLVAVKPWIVCSTAYSLSLVCSTNEDSFTVHNVCSADALQRNLF